MARKRRKKQFRVVETVKALARERIGTPPAERVVPNKKRKLSSKEEKHKPTLGGLLSEDSG